MSFVILFLVASLIGTACTGHNEPDTSKGDPTPTLTDASVNQSGTVTTGEPEHRSNSVSVSPSPPSLPNLGPAPAWHNEVWINSDRPLILADLRGKVVLLEFWTFG